ncbi:MAG: AAA family ATP:ADP antiporter [Alteromonas naphthalenivorans]|jgi:AAA family ATP:ADP antiporter
MFSGIIQYFYPDLKKEELNKFTHLAVAFLFTAGTYWLLRLVKDDVIYKIAFSEEFGWPIGYGATMVAKLKTISPFVVMGALAVYTKLIDMFEKQQLFYVIGTFFASVFAFVALMLCSADTLGVEAIKAFSFGPMLLGAAGSLGYLATEAFGSLMMAVFWSFTVSSATSDQAKRGFPFVIVLGQIGAISASSVMYFKGNFPTWPLYFIAIAGICGLIFTIKSLMKSVPASEMTSGKVEKKKSKPDVLAGFKLLVTQPYLMGVFVVSTFYEVAKVVVDMQMKYQASVIMPKAEFARFLGIFGMCVNSLSLLMALLGTAYAMKKYGLRVCLLIYPIMFGACLTGIYFYYLTGPTAENLFWATFGAMMIVTAVSYAVNNPVKEMMYIPTSKDAKFKAKGLVDMVGGRAGKMAGANIGGALIVSGNVAASIAGLMTTGTLISLGVICVWLLVAIYVGIKNAQLVRDGEIIE